MAANSEAQPDIPTTLTTPTGMVVAVQANYYQVQLDTTPALPPEASPTLLCTRRSRLKKIGQQVMVGDRVLVEDPDWAGGRGAIAQVFPRQSELSRPPIANTDQILLVFSLADPPLEPYQLSRFLVKAESTGLAVRLGLNKSDLIPVEQQAQWHSRLMEWGYQPILMSLHTQNGLADLRTALDQRATVISGPSGVGKSSLINHLIPTVDLRVGEVSGKLGRGRHTTRHVELFALPTGGVLADSPGFNQPTLDAAPEELTDLFPEARKRLEVHDCQFSNCLHRDEPNCAVRGDWERYEHYLIFLEEAIARQTFLHEQANPDASLKVKTNAQGQNRYEPRLEAKKYRRVGRRTQQQALKELYREDLQGDGSLDR